MESAGMDFREEIIRCAKIIFGRLLDRKQFSFEEVRKLQSKQQEVKQHLAILVGWIEKLSDAFTVEPDIESPEERILFNLFRPLFLTAGREEVILYELFLRDLYTRDLSRISMLEWEELHSFAERGYVVLELHYRELGII